MSRLPQHSEEVGEWRFTVDQWNMVEINPSGSFSDLRYGQYTFDPSRPPNPPRVKLEALLPKGELLYNEITNPTPGEDLEYEVVITARRRFKPGYYRYRNRSDLPNKSPVSYRETPPWKEYPASARENWERVFVNVAKPS